MLPHVAIGLSQDSGWSPKHNLSQGLGQPAGGARHGIAGLRSTQPDSEAQDAGYIQGVVFTIRRS